MMMMMSRYRRLFNIIGKRSFGYCASGSSSSLKVAIIGAGGNTGRSLALCLKQCPLIDELAIHDTYAARNLLLELTYMDTSCISICHGPDDTASGKLGLERALRGAKIVALVADGELCEEARRLEKIVPSILTYCPKALVALVSRSVNSLLPMLFELYKKSGYFECDRLFGVLNLFSTRANNFAAEVLSIDPEFVSVPLMGGGCARTCVPLFSMTRPCAEFSSEELGRLRQAMKSADQRVAEAYAARSAGAGLVVAAADAAPPVSESSAFSTGFSAARFCVSLCKALRDEPGVHECAYTRSCLIPELTYVGAPLELGPGGIRKHLGVPRLADQECDDLYRAIPEIKRAIALGEALALGLKESALPEFCPAPQRCAALQLYQQPGVTHA